MKKISIFLLVCMAFFSAGAARIEWGRNITISDPVYEDLYIAGGTVTINAPVYGDLIVAGGTIYINDTIMNDLLLAGGTVQINGYVADDIRCAGGEVNVLNNVGGDLVVTGGRVNIAQKVIINGSFITSGGEIVANGTINGDIRSTAGKFIFNGTARRNFACRSHQLTINGTVIGTAAIGGGTIKIGDNASFYGNVRFWNAGGSPNFKNSIKGGIVTLDETLKVKPNAWYYLGHSTVLGLVWYLSTVLLFIILIQYLFRNTFKKAGDTFDHSRGKSLSWGLLFFIGVPFSIVLLLITIVGLPIGLLMMFSYVVILLLATIITSLVLANWCNYRYGYHWNYWKIVFVAMALFVLLKLVTFAPFVGWLVMIAVACIAFGSILRNINWRPNRQVLVQS